MSRRFQFAVLLIAVALSVTFVLYTAQAAPTDTSAAPSLSQLQVDPYPFPNYLPVVFQELPTATPVPTWTPAPTATPRPTSTPVPFQIVNGGFEAGPYGWTEYSEQGYYLILPSSGLPIPPHSGNWATWLGGDNNEHAAIVQTIEVPAVQPYLSYWLWIGSDDSTCYYDVGGVIIDDGSQDDVVDSYYLCTANNTGGWIRRIIDLRSYIGQTVNLIITAETGSYYVSSLFIDNVFLTHASTAQQTDTLKSKGTKARLRNLASSLSESNKQQRNQEPNERPDFDRRSLSE